MKKLIYLLLLVPFCVNAQIVNIPDANFKTKLIQLGVDTNSDGEIQNAEALAVTNLNLNNSTISSLSGIEAFLNLTDLSFRNNLVTNIDFINSLNSLGWLDGAQNQIQAVHFTTNNGFIYFDVSNNLISSVTSSEIIFIGESLMNNNLITDLDLSKIKLSGGLHTYFNNPLVSVNLKNNYIEDVNVLGGMTNPTLQFVCVDEDQESEIVQYLIDLAMPSVVVSTYCSFVPGGNYNTITGATTLDLDNNGCDVADLPKPNIKININDGTNQGATFSNNSGDYNFYTQAGSFTLTPNIENPSWFTFSPATATIPFADNNNNISEQNFCISPNGIHNDLEVVIAPITPARPGFDATYEIVYKNKGNQTLSGNVSLTFDDDKTDFVTSNPNPDNLNLNSLSWNYTNLLPFENRVILLTLNVNGPTETPAVNIGDVLHFTTTINPTAGDELPNDNTFNYNQIVVGSFDPNNIECLEGAVVAPSYIGQYLHYAVNFENTGNFPAENVLVKIVIDTTKYDINSLQLMHVSHNSYTRISGNIVEVIFQQVNLDSGGHGNLLFKIRTNSNLVEGNSVAKRADIFFDYNAPIDTGMANTTFQTLSNSVFELDDSIAIYPNPSKNNVNIKCNSTIKSVELYDVQGRLLQTQLLDEVQTSIDISEKSTGIYFLKITSDKGSKVEKIMKK